MILRLLSKTRRGVRTFATTPAATPSASTKAAESSSATTSSTKPPGDRGWTAGEFHSVEDTLEKHIPAKELEQVKKVLYGLNQGQLVETLKVPSKAQKIADEFDFDVSISQFKASNEDQREPRVVRFGVAQNSIHLPTDAPIQEQIESLWAIHENFVKAAAAAGTNVLCFQEAWTMPFAFCTREKLPWTNFAEVSGFLSLVCCVCVVRCALHVPWCPSTHQQTLFPPTDIL